MSTSDPVASIGKSNPLPQARFINKYRDALHAIAETIENSNADYVLALTRRAPRILELMKKSGVWDGNTPVLSEKSLDFMPRNLLKNKQVILFDDIVISGSTIESVRSNLEEYGANIDTLTLAVDGDTIAINKENIDFQLELTRSKRYEFSKDVVQALIHLNKPYDVDHAIFYSYLGEDSVNKFRNGNNSYDITTINQDRNGYERYSYILSGSEGLTNDILTPDSVDVQINKLRAYYDVSTQQGSLVPTIIFSINKDDVHSEVFTDELALYNDLLKKTSKFLNSENEAKAMYRLIFFLTSYLEGISFCSSHSGSDERFLENSPPRELLDFQDLCYLFGPSVAQIVLEFLETHYDETKNGLAELRSDQPAGDVAETDPTLSGTEERLIFEESQSELYDSINGYLSSHITGRANYSRALSTVFEAIYTQIELKKQKELRQRSESQSETETRRMLREEHKRLEVGFNFSQLKVLLEAHGTPINDIGLSLAMDYLIDKGVPIPQFSEREISWMSNGEHRQEVVIERVYRHGENCLDNKTYEYVINSAVDALFEYAEEHGIEKLNQIPFEKMGAFFEDKLTNFFYWDNPALGTFDALRLDPLESQKQKKTLKVGATYHRHGKVLNIREASKLDSGNLFVDWCDDVGIIEVIEENGQKKGLKRSTTWEEENERINDSTSSVPRAELSSFKNLAKVLFEIEEFVDEGTGDYLTALISCRNKKELLHSMRKELQLFFEDDQYRLMGPIERTRKQVDQRSDLLEHSMVDPNSKALEDFADILESELKHLNEYPFATAHGVEHKQLLWENLDEKIEKIGQYFQNHKNSAVTGMYEQNLEPYLNNILSRHYPETTGEALRERIVTIGRLCVKLATVHRKLLECSIAILRTSEATAEARDLNDAIKSLNSMAQDDQVLRKIYLDELPTIATDDLSARLIGKKKEEFRPQDVFTLINTVLPQIKDAYDTLSEPYRMEFGPSWEEKIADVFPDDEEWEELDHSWVLWFDIKDSSGAEDAANREWAKRMNNQLDKKLRMLQGLTSDGFWKVNRDDDCHIFLRKSDSVYTYLNGILDLASDCNTQLRVSICRVEPGDLKKHRYESILDSETAHIRAVRVGNVPDKDYNCHTLSIDGTAKEDLDDDIYPWEVDQSWKQKGDIKTETVDFNIKGMTTQLTTHISKFEKATGSN